MDEIMQEITQTQNEITALMLELQESAEEFHEDIEDDIRRCMEKISELEEELREFKNHCDELDYRHAEFERMV